MITEMEFTFNQYRKDKAAKRFILAAVVGKNYS
jgi:hypothetical protein